MTKASQSGIAIAPILFVVGILAVLATAIAAGSGAFNSSSSAVNDKAMAAAIIEMGQQYKYAAQRVLANGYTDTQISFEDPSGTISRRVDGIVTSCVNAQCSEDGCKVFKPAGGGIVPNLIPDAAVSKDSWAWLDGNLHPQSSQIYASLRVLNIGTDTAGSDGTDLVLGIGTLKKSVCIKINELLGVENPEGNPPYGGLGCDTSRFAGAYGNCATAFGASANWQGQGVAGKEAFCYSPFTPARYSFYQVLIAR